MTEWLQSLSFWHWWIVAVVLLLIEVMAPSTLLLWPALSAALVGLLLLLMPNLDWHSQWLIFAVATVVSAMIGRAYLRNRPIKTDKPTLNRRGEQYLGRMLTLDTAIVNGVGRIRIDDTQWRIQGEDMPAGTRVRVNGVEGSTLLVSAADP